MGGPLKPRKPVYFLFFIEFLGGGRYSNGFVDQFWCGLAVSDPKSDHPDTFWYLFHQKLVFWTFQALWSWAAFLAGAFFFIK